MVATRERTAALCFCSSGESRSSRIWKISGKRGRTMVKAEVPLRSVMERWTLRNEVG